MRPELAHPPMTAAAAAEAAVYKADVVAQVREAVAAHEVVVIGMAWNTHVGKIRKELDAAGVKHHYLELGSYLGRWRDRLAVKLWTGWPTFPQVFVKGTFVGGAELTRTALADRTIAKLLGREASSPAA
jgi:glutaredoxin-related protein